jgi:Family of unknown function (DUF6111)
MRLFLQYVLPLLLPFLLYATYVALAHGRMPNWLALNEREWVMLGGTGLALLMISLVTWSLLSGSPPDETYIPPHLEDGRIVPGTTVADD